MYPLSDGNHLVHVRCSAGLQVSNALTFYRKGQAFKSYALSELLQNQDLLEFSHCTGDGNWCENVTLKEDQELLEIQTIDAQTHRFSLYTGERLKPNKR